MRAKSINERVWGRNDSPTTMTVILSAGVMFLSPLVVIAAWNICHKHSGNALEFITSIQSSGVSSIWPKFSLDSLLLYAGWLAFQALLYQFLPAPLAYGQETPAGHVLPYRVNGLLAWVLCNAGFPLLALGLGLFPLSIIADHWDGLLVATNFYAFLLVAVTYVKALVAPSHPNDCKYTGSWLYDFYMGIELNPRIGELFDFKLFHVGRPNMLGWTMINMSFGAAQYARFGKVTDSMILVNLLQALYVVDFFVHEDWYLKTIDIAHDHFGFMFSWGDSVWLPFMYTLQAQYLAYNPIQLGGPLFWTILAMGILGYAIFREANFQKDICRRTDGKCMIWGRPARVIRTTYVSTDGVQHRSLLLTSGFWGLARHCNYLGDLILSTAMCLATGSSYLLPYFYAVFMGVLLLHRVERDHDRCHVKYGKYWEEYCRLVPSKLIPGIY